MKRIWIAAVLTALIFTGSFFYTSYLDKACGEMTALVDEAYNRADSGSLEYINRTDAALERASMIFCLFLDSKLINEVEDSIILCRELDKNRNTDRLRTELVLLREKVNHLKESEKFDLKSIL